MAEFTETFNVEEATAESYKEFIENLRKRLGAGYLHNPPNLPLLPLQENERPTRFFDITLQTSNRSITVRFRRDNLYGVGYQMENGQWLELGIASEHPPQLIPGSTFLGIGLTYEEGYLQSLLLGHQQLINAVNELSRTDDQAIRKRSLMIIIQMFCEAIRFSEITDTLANNFEGSMAPTSRMINLEHIWGDLSRALRDYDVPNSDFHIPPNRLNIQYSTQAIAVLGIVLQACANPRMAGIDDDEEVCSGGRPLVEVYSVKILDIDGENPGDLYGTIQVSDGLNTQYIFNRARDNIQSIGPGEFALLTGPDRSMSAYGNFTIDLDLMDRDRESFDDEVSKGKISWEVYNTTNVYNATILSPDVRGDDGSAQVSYIVLSDAVQATVEAWLINGDGENPADVYGRLTARNSNITNESVLFNKTSDEYVDVYPGNRIPLLRSVIAVPLNSSLIIQADLWDYDSIGYNDEIAKGTAEFLANLSGTFEKPIKGEYGEINVKVTWT